MNKDRQITCMHSDRQGSRWIRFKELISLARLIYCSQLEKWTCPAPSIPRPLSSTSRARALSYSNEAQHAVATAYRRISYATGYLQLCCLSLRGAGLQHHRTARLNITPK